MSGQLSANHGGSRTPVWKLKLGLSLQPPSMNQLHSAEESGDIHCHPFWQIHCFRVRVSPCRATDRVSLPDPLLFPGIPKLEQRCAYACNPSHSTNMSQGIVLYVLIFPECYSACILMSTAPAHYILDLCNSHLDADALSSHAPHMCQPFRPPCPHQTSTPISFGDPSLTTVQGHQSRETRDFEIAARCATRLLPGSAGLGIPFPRWRRTARRKYPRVDCGETARWS